MPARKIPQAHEGQVWQCRDQAFRATVRGLYSNAIGVMVHTTFGHGENTYQQNMGRETLVRVTTKSEESYRVRRDRHNSYDLVRLLYQGPNEAIVEDIV